MKPTLLVLAAGMGSRYGGIKQIDTVGKNGECLLDYAAYDAKKCGFEKIVYIIRKDIEKDFRERLFDRIAKNIDAEYVFQSPEALLTADEYALSQTAGRKKPWGTLHAVLCAKKALNTPYAVINADDYYGVDAYRTMYSALRTIPAEGAAAMVGYMLRNTVTAHGTVSRGVCHVKDGCLTDIHETLKIALLPDGTIRDEDTGAVLAGDTVVSMNFWGFTPSIFGELERYFHAFLRSEAGQSVKAECLLPTMVGDLLAQGRLTVSVLHSADRWFGMTYHEDRARVAQELVKLHETGVYPAELR